MRKKIMFTHIPKTAGTSFKEEVIRPNYRDIFMYKGRKSLLEIYLKKPSFITGHVPLGVIKHYLKSYEYLTFLRDPVERAISHYFFILESKSDLYEHPNYKACCEIPLEEIYGLRLTDNLQTRYLSGKGYYSGKCTESMLIKAKQNLEKYYKVYGIQEQYDASVRLICSYFNLNLFSNSKELFFKKTYTKPEVNAEVREILASQHTFDIQMYRYALNRFEEMRQELEYVTSKN